MENNQETPPAPKPNTITAEHINALLLQSQLRVTTAFDKSTIVSCKLPCGFIITEDSSCVDPENYDLEIGKAICLNRIRDKLWELEGYRLQCSLHEKNMIAKLGGLPA